MGNEGSIGKLSLSTEHKERDKVRREKLAGYFFDLSKLSFGGIVAGIILPLLADVDNVVKWTVLVLGIILTVLLALLANKILAFKD